MTPMKKTRRNDLLLILGLLAAACAAAALLALTRQPGAYVRVLEDGQEIARHSLKADGVYEIETAYGANTLTITDGQAAVTWADCPDGICVHSAPAARQGQTIVCLPHRLVVEICGAEEADVDVVAR